MEDPATSTTLCGSLSPSSLEGQTGKKLLEPLHLSSEIGAIMPPKKSGKKYSDPECSEGKSHKATRSPTDSELFRSPTTQNQGVSGRSGITRGIIIELIALDQSIAK